MKYTQFDRSNIIHSYLHGKKIAAIATETGIPKSTIYAWIKSYGMDNAKTDQIVSRKESRALIQRNTRLEGMIEVLKMVDCTISSPLQEKLNVIETLHGKYSVHLLCDALEVARGTYYNHIFRNKRDNTIYAKRREELCILVRNVYNEYDQIFGARKICTILRDRGHKTSEKTVRGLMQEMGLYGIGSTSKREYTKWKKGENKNVLQQNFHAEALNQAWVSDVTVFKFNDKYYYICVIIDLYSRKIVAHTISQKNSTQLVTKTFKKAYELRQPKEGMIFHSDRGAPYVSFSFQKLLNKCNVIQSLSRLSAIRF